MKEKRRRLWIDRFQTLLSLRIAFYFILYQVAVWSLFATINRLSNDLDRWLGPSVAAYAFLIGSVIVLLLGLLFIYDALVLTHRLVGPVYRFRKMVQAVKSDQQVDWMSLRQGDFFHDLKDEFNEMLEVLERRGAITIKSREPARKPDQPVSV
jgi:hypothetical protein